MNRYRVPESEGENFMNLLNRDEYYFQHKWNQLTTLIILLEGVEACKHRLTGVEDRTASKLTLGLFKKADGLNGSDLTGDTISFFFGLNDSAGLSLSL